MLQISKQVKSELDKGKLYEDYTKNWPVIFNQSTVDNSF